jgi:hypothetical protein
MQEQCRKDHSYRYSDVMQKSYIDYARALSVKWLFRISGTFNRFSEECFMLWCFGLNFDKPTESQLVLWGEQWVKYHPHGGQFYL